MFRIAALISFAAALSCQAAAPIALHELVIVNSTSDAVIRLRGYDTDGDNLKYTVISAPATGKLHQLSQVFSAYGYNPKAGTQFPASGAVVTGSKNRVYYKRPSPDAATNKKWGSFQFRVSDSLPSYPGTVTLVPPSGALIGSNFLLSNEQWNIVNNKVTTAATHEPYSRGAMLNHYIIASDDKINVDTSNSNDKSLWYFDAPASYFGNNGIAYGGSLTFTLAAFAGDFSKLNANTNIVELRCAECVGPVGPGITLAFPVSALTSQHAKLPFTGAATVFTLSLTEHAGWMKDPQNSIVAWTKPSKCDIIQVLSRLSSLRILGDWTQWMETVALDNVMIYNTKGQLPVCALGRPDASVCTC